MKLTTVLAFFLSWSLAFFEGLSVAAPSPQPVATITKFFGKVNILSVPGTQAGTQPARAIFEGTEYLVEAAKMGSKVYPGSVIQTREKSMARLVFDNGDQVMVAAQSSYKLSSDKKSGGEEKPVSDLLYGKFRAIISKDGPRKDMEVRTRTMVMGIRGTDFHVSASDASGSSTVSVLRGAVAVSQKNAGPEAAAQPINVAAGFSAKIPEKSSVAAEAQGPAPAAAIAVVKTDKIDLQEIQQSVSFKQAPGAATPEPPLDPEVQQSLAKLEELAVVTTKADIKASDPELYKKIEAAESKGKKVTDLEVLQDVTLAKALVLAPEASPEKLKNSRGEPKPAAPLRKPSKEELKDMEEDVYNKYFKE